MSTARKQLLDGAGTQFDADVVKVFLDLTKDFDYFTTQLDSYLEEKNN